MRINTGITHSFYSCLIMVTLLFGASTAANAQSEGERAFGADFGNRHGDDPCTNQHARMGQIYCNDVAHCAAPETCGQCQYDEATDLCFTPKSLKHARRVMGVEAEFLDADAFADYAAPHAASATTESQSVPAEQGDPCAEQYDGHGRASCNETEFCNEPTLCAECRYDEFNDTCTTDDGTIPEEYRFIRDVCSEQHIGDGRLGCNDPKFCGDPSLCGRCGYDKATDHCFTQIEAAARVSPRGVVTEDGSTIDVNQGQNARTAIATAPLMNASVDRDETDASIPLVGCDTSGGAPLDGLALFGFVCLGCVRRRRRSAARTS